MPITYENLLKVTKKMVNLSREFCYCFLCVPNCAILSIIKNYGTTNNNVIVLNNLPNNNMCHFRELAPSTIFYLNENLSDFLVITEKFAVYSNDQIESLSNPEKEQEFTLIYNNSDYQPLYDLVFTRAMKTIDLSTLVNTEYLKEDKHDYSIRNIRKILNLL